MPGTQGAPWGIFSSSLFVTRRGPGVGGTWAAPGSHPTHRPAGGGARLGSVPCPPGHPQSPSPLPDDCLPEASLCLPVPCLPGSPFQGLFQSLLALGPHTFSVLGVGEAMDSLGESDIPVCPRP